MCLLDKHKTQDVVDVIAEHTGKLEDKIDLLCVDRFREQMAYKRNKESLEEIMKRKIEIEKKFDDMLESTRSEIAKTERNTERLESEIQKLCELKVKIKKTCKESKEEAKIVENLDSDDKIRKSS